IVGGTASNTGRVWHQFILRRSSRRFAFLRTRQRRYISWRRLLCRSHPQRYEASRSARSISGKISYHAERQDRQGTRFDGAAISSAARRRGDRVRRERMTNPSVWEGPSQTLLVQEVPI